MNNKVVLNTGTWLIVLFFCLLFSLLFSTSAQAQYKSRLFNDANKDLSDSEQQNIAALEAAFAGYEDNYQIASTGQFLARQMVAAQDYEKAAEYYAKTLETQVLDELVAIPLRREYAQVLLLLGRFNQVQQVLNFEVLATPDRLLLARASLGQQQFHRAIEWLQPLNANLPNHEDAILKQLAAIYYEAKATALATDVLAELHKRHPNDIELARQLTGLHIQLQQFNKALDLWSLTFSKGLINQQQDWVLLTDLHQRQGSPEKAARLMTEGLQMSVISHTAQHYYRLFEFWYQAKEPEQAREALWQSVSRSQKIEHGLILAELLQQAELWQALLELIQFSCQTVLPDRYVGRINLMLGIALHKLGDNQDARRALINASLVSGVKTHAREWLKFIDATPATIEESKALWGECLPADPSIELPDVIAAATETASENETVPPAEPQEKLNSLQTVKTISLASARFYGTKLKTSGQKLEQDLKRKTFNLIKNLMRSGGKADGKMHLLFDEVQTADNINVTIAFPFSGAPANRSGHRVIRTPQARAITKTWQGPATELASQWQSLVNAATVEGLTPTGQSRMIFLSDTAGTGTLDVELQLIIE